MADVSQIQLGSTVYDIKDAAARDDISALRAAVGSPLVAGTVAGMTNHDKIYVYTGSETGYNNGHWYYWDGSAWSDGGVYNETALETDTTLTVSGSAADSKTVGDKVDDLKSAIKVPFNMATSGITWTAGRINWSDGTATSSSTAAKKTDFVDITGISEIMYTRLWATNLSTDLPPHGIAFYDSNGTCIGGIRSDYAAPIKQSYLYCTKVPTGATQARFTAWAEDYNEFELYDASEYYKSVQSNDDLQKEILNYDPFVLKTLQIGTIFDGVYINSNSKIQEGEKQSELEFPADGYVAVTITASNNYVARISFLTSSIVGLSAGDTPPYCEGESSHDIPAGKTETFLIPDDCNYIDLSYTYAAKSSSPIQYVYPYDGYLIKDPSVLIKISDGILAERACSHSKTPVTACVIGSSSELGTTHETASSGAVINPSKAYLTVALQNNGVTVTNHSHGGMGYIDTASDGTVFKDIVDSIDFSEFDSLYLSLGTSDYKDNQPLGNPSDTGASTVCGMLKYALNKVYTDNPFIKVFVIGPRITTRFGDVSTQWSWKANNNAAIPYTEKEMCDALNEICESMLIEFWGDPSMKSIVNMYNITTILPDGVHTTKAGMAQWAKAITGLITFK